MKCVLCKGSGEQPPIPKTSLEKKNKARILKRKGFTHKAIAEIIGWKSTFSVVQALRD